MKLGVSYEGNNMDGSVLDNRVPKRKFGPKLK
jgi:hypothetical protein